MSRHDLTLRSALLAALPLAALLAPSGCASIDRTMLGMDDDHVAVLGEPEPRSAWDKVGEALGVKPKDVSPYMRPVVPPEAQSAYLAAKRLYDAGKYEESEDAAKGLAKKYRDTVLEEDALFLQAESQFARKRYAAAQDTYSELFERFPSTRYMDQSTKHLFEIARYWLQGPELVRAGDVQPANFDAPSKSPLPPPKETGFDVTRSAPFLPNVSDRTRPVFDTEGRALEALKSIWLHDPVGPLADDAVMMSASYHLRNGDYMEADRFYDILRSEYPKSPHLEDAYVLGSHVKLMSYQGSAYDATTLEDARELKEGTLKLFPKTAERDRLLDELRKTDDAQAERKWEVVRFYQRKGRDHSVAFACHDLITKFPTSKYAAEARRVYASLPAEAKSKLPALPGVPKRTVMPDLQPVPSSPPPAPPAETAEDASPGRVAL